jgi:hypothetical protein
MSSSWCESSTSGRLIRQADYQAAHALFGRYPSFARLMKNARIKDQIPVFD